MSNHKPPGPEGNFLLGSILDFRADPPGFLVDLAYTYGDITTIRLGPATAYLMAHPDYIRDVLVVHASKFHKAQLDKQILSKFLGNGLLISDGDFHRQQRTLVQPAFHAKRIQAYGQAMVGLTEQMLAKWDSGQVLDIDEEMMRLTMAIVSKTLFDADVSAQADRVGRAIATLQTLANAEYKRSFSIPMWIPTPNNLKSRRAAVVLDETIEHIIAERRATAGNGTIADTGDLLSMLLLAQMEDGETMSDRQVRDEAVTLFAAGHETTSNALSWTWYLLAQHPGVEARLHAELARVLGGRAPTVDDLGKLPYTEMVIKETLRLYPPAWILNGRTAIEDLSIGGYDLKAGSLVFIAPYVTHRLPNYFPDPERFDPERFLPEKEKALPRYAYMPFGGGPRICIGNAFASMEARLILATVAQRFRLLMAGDHEVVLNPQITLSPKDGLRMKLVAR